METIHAKPRPPREFNPRAPRSQRGQAELEATEAALVPPVVAPAATSALARPCTLISTALLCVAFAGVVHFLNSSNLLKPLYYHNFQACTVVRGPIGAEDVRIEPSHQVLLISSDSRDWIPTTERDGITGAHEARLRISKMMLEDQGAIWAYDTRPVKQDVNAAPGERMVKLEIEGMPESVKDFHPHGINLPPVPTSSEDWKEGGGGEEDEESEGDKPPIFLYIISHARDGDDIIVVEVTYSSAVSFPPRLLFRAQLSLRSMPMGFANAVEAFYPVRHTDGSWTHSVYVSNSMGTAPGDTLMNVVEQFTFRPWASIVLCQGRTHGTGVDSQTETQCQMILPNLVSPNGLAMTGDRTRLYVAMLLDQTIATYDLPTRPATKADEWRHGSRLLAPLTFHHATPIGTCADNLVLDSETGDIYIGAHPKPLAAASHLQNSTRLSPTQALRFTPAEGRQRRRPDFKAADAAAAPATDASEGQPAASSPPSKKEADRYEELHLSDGSAFSGIATAAFNRQTNQIFMGGMAQNGIYICPLPAKV